MEIVGPRFKREINLGIDEWTLTIEGHGPAVLSAIILNEGNYNSGQESILENSTTIYGRSIIKHTIKYGYLGYEYHSELVSYQLEIHCSHEEAFGGLFYDTSDFVRNYFERTANFTCYSRADWLSHKQRTRYANNSLTDFIDTL
jgi:hypothetical protein